MNCDQKDKKTQTNLSLARKPLGAVEKQMPDLKWTYVPRDYL